jgi:hypothetical protein
MKTKTTKATETTTAARPTENVAKGTSEPECASASDGTPVETTSSADGDVPTVRRIGDFEIHPASLIIPDLEGAEFESLKSDIEEHGQRDPVELYEGRVLDKRAVLRACIELGIAPRIVEVTFEGAPTDYVISKMKGRRPSPVQLACVAVLARDHFAARARDRQRQAGGARTEAVTDDPSASGRQVPRHQGEWVAEAAKAVGAGVTAVKIMDRVHREALKVFDAAHRGLVPTVTVAEALAKEPEHEQAEVLEDLRLFGGDPQGAARHARETIARHRRQRLVDGIPTTPQEGLDYQLYVGDLDEVGRRVDEQGAAVVPDESIDKIITDPPYDREAASELKKLGDFAWKKLKPGGSLFVLIGGVLVPDLLDSMREAGLTYHWPLVWASTGTTIVWNRKVMSQTKLVVWFTKGSYTGRSIMTDLVPCFSAEKALHPWQQSVDAFTDLMELVSDPGDLVLDPFCGAGTTGDAALWIGRRFIGIDVDGEAIKIASDRLGQLVKFLGADRMEKLRERAPEHAAAVDVTNDPDTPACARTEPAKAKTLKTPKTAAPAEEGPSGGSVATEVDRAEPQPDVPIFDEPSADRVLGVSEAGALRLRGLYPEIPIGILLKMIAEHESHALGGRGGRETARRALDEQLDFVRRLQHCDAYIMTHGSADDHARIRPLTRLLDHSKRIALGDVRSAEELVRAVADARGDEYPFGRSTSPLEAALEAAAEQVAAMEAAEAAELNGDDQNGGPVGTPTPSR